MRYAVLFTAPSIAGAAAGVGGALLGGTVLGTDAGFFGAGLAAAGLAVLATLAVLGRAGCVPARRARAVRVGALLGLVLAGGLAVVTAITVVVPLLGFALVGAGVVLADVDAAAAERYGD
jgi:hypothetical protein